MIRICNVTRRYGDLVAVDDVSTRIRRGEIVGLLGHNGAGKTTLMKLICGTIAPSTGTVVVGQCDVVNDRRGVQRQIGYLPESAPLYPELMVQEYLLMSAELRGLGPDERVPAALRAARQTGLVERLTQRIGTLSKGFRQRVGIAQAILHRPDLLVLDEPTNGLDPAQIQAIRALIRDLASQTTIILSTHILQEVEAVCDRVLVLIDGRLVADAPLGEMLAGGDVHLSVGAAAVDVPQSIMSFEGVEGTRIIGEDPSRDGYLLWSITCEPEVLPEIVRRGVGLGWSIGGAYRHRETLEMVYSRLAAEHVARAGHIDTKGAP